MRRLVLSGFLNLLLVTRASASEDISSVWRDLFTRCRVTIETGKVFDATGLRDLGRSVRATQPVTVPGLPNPLIPGYQMTERRWKTHETRFIVTEAEFPPNGGKVRRSCDVELNRQARPISPAEEEALRAAFSAERTSLLNTGLHKSWDPDPIFSTNLGIRLAGHNPRNCPVVSYLMIETRPHSQPFFKSGAGEQANDCGGEPLIPHP